MCRKNQFKKITTRPTGKDFVSLTAEKFFSPYRYETNGEVGQRNQKGLRPVLGGAIALCVIGHKFRIGHQSAWCVLYHTLHSTAPHQLFGDAN